MKNIVWFLWVCLIMNGIDLSCAEPTKSESRWQDAKELYSWRSVDGEWNFCILPEKNSLYTDKVILDSKITIHGLESLKEKLLSLPLTASVTWSNAPPGCSKTILYPNIETRSKIFQFVKEHQIPFTILGNGLDIAMEEIVPLRR